MRVYGFGGQGSVFMSLFDGYDIAVTLSDALGPRAIVKDVETPAGGIIGLDIGDHITRFQGESLTCLPLALVDRPYETRRCRVSVHV